MCGIAGVFDYRSPYDNPAAAGAAAMRNAVAAMSEAMAVRGPDGSGEWLSPDGRAAFGHRRLAIIDLRDSALQPMTDSGTGLTVVFNGEIYNYRHLRSELVARGHHFRTESDTEVLLHLYAEYGGAMCGKLRGMFAFAIRDSRSGSLFLARDAHGIKPLYFADDGRSFRFASQVKGLLTDPSVDTSPEPAGYVGYYLWGSVPEPYTLFRGIRSLAPGTSLEIDADGRTTVRTFCSVDGILAAAEQQQNQHRRSSGPTAEELHAQLLDSVRHHLVADVPIAVFLSAGVDSQCIATLARETGQDVRTVTMGFEEYRGTPSDEVPLAEECARKNGALHTTRVMTGDDFGHELTRFMASMDQPTIDGMNVYMVSKAAAELGLKVCLSGVGGDELFAGYDTFSRVPKIVRAARALVPFPSVGRAVRWVSAGWIGRFTSPKYAGLLELGRSFEGAYLLKRGLFMPWELPRVLPPEVVREGWGLLAPMARAAGSAGISHPALRVASLEMTRYMRNQLLRDSDWAGMAHSIEIRVPLVDVPLLQAVAPALAGPKPPRKAFVAEACRLGLPPRPKTGFSIPVREWFAQQSGLGTGSERGLRGWSRYILAQVYGSRRILVAN